MDVSHLNETDSDIDLPSAKPSNSFFYLRLRILNNKFLKQCPIILFLFLGGLIPVFSQTSNFIESNGVETHYLEWGKGENTIVLIHGLSDTAEIWKDLAVILAKNYRIIAPDRRGTGKSEKPSANYDSQTLAADIEKLLDALKVKRATVIGHSFGGNTAMTLAANSPGKISSLILIEGGFWEKREPMPLPECSAPISEDCLISNSVQRGINEYNPEKLFPKIYAPTLLMLGLPPELNKINLNDAEKINKKFFDEAVKNINNTAKNKLKNAKSLVIKNAQHWVFIDQPEIVAKEVKKFIKN